MNDLYHAVPLPHARCTRVIELLNETPGDATTLHLRIQAQDVDEWKQDDKAFGTSVAALSYTWEAPWSTPEYLAGYGPDQDVEVKINAPDGRMYSRKISRNLHDALLNIQCSEREYKYLWVDAISINQDNLREKSQQVMLMYDIYSKANLVVVWLGIQDSSPKKLRENTMWLMENLVPKLEGYDEDTVCTDMTFTETDWGASTDVYSRKLDLTIPSEVLRALYHVFARNRYLQRAWIVQEIALAENASLLLGTESFDFWNLVRLALLFRRHVLVNTAFVEPGCAPETQGTGQELCTLQFMRFYSKCFLATDEESQEFSKNLLMDLYGVANEYALLELYLSFGHQRQATDSRDVIYSVLALINAVMPVSQEFIRPDYQSSTRDIFVDTTKKLLQHVPNLSILSLVSGPVPGLPSWCPDYSSAKTAGKDPLNLTYSFWCEIKPDFAASGFSKVSIRIDDDEVLVLRGMPGPKVQQVYCPFPEPFAGNDLSVKVRDAVGLVTTILSICSEYYGAEGVYPTGERALEAIFRVIMDVLPKQVGSTSFAEAVKLLLLDTVCDAAIFGPEHCGRLVELLRSWEGEWAIPSSSELTWAEDCGKKLELGTLTDVDREKCQAIVRGKKDVKQLPDMALFVVEKGFFGRIGSEVEVGDEVWLLCGAKVPFILRKTGEEDGGYVLVGEALVHGAMYGEWIERGTVGEAREIRVV